MNKQNDCKHCGRSYQQRGWLQHLRSCVPEHMAQRLGTDLARMMQWGGHLGSMLGNVGHGRLPVEAANNMAHATDLELVAFMMAREWLPHLPAWALIKTASSVADFKNQFEQRTAALVGTDLEWVELETAVGTAVWPIHVAGQYVVGHLAPGSDQVRMATGVRGLGRVIVYLKVEPEIARPWAVHIVYSNGQVLCADDPEHGDRVVFYIQQAAAHRLLAILKETAAELGSRWVLE